MYRRRRRPEREIAFSFDSFLDLVTNVVGIIIRLILVTWVGARSYHSSMQWVNVDPAPATEAPSAAEVKEYVPPRITDDPLYPKIEIARHEIEEIKKRLTERLKELDLTEGKAEQ